MGDTLFIESRKGSSMFWSRDLKNFKEDFIFDNRDFGGHVADVDPGFLVFVADSVEAEVIERAIV